MTFSVRQSGQIRRISEPRRPPFEISVADFKGGASRGWPFWRGIVLGIGAGLILCYVAMTGTLPRFWQ